jgi:membrane protease YdiL (CAAX protease family)
MPSVLAASARAPVPSRGLLVALGLSLGMVSLLGVMHHARQLSAAERAVVMTDVRTGAWHGTRDELGLFTVRPGDVLRITACPAAGGDPHLRLDVHTSAGERLFERPLTAAASDARRCVGLRWAAPCEATLGVALTAAAPSSPPLRRVALYVGPELRPALTWPWLALLVSLSLLVLAPSISGPALRRAPTLGSLIYRPIVDRPGAPAALVAAFVGCVFLSGQVFRALGATPAGTLLGGATLHLCFGLSAAWLLGGLSEDGPPLRTALGLDRTAGRWLSLAVPLALALLALALLTSVWITDTSESSVARDVASSPLRLALLYTALLAPLSEELFYRGAVTRALERFGPSRAIVLQAVVFTLPHALQLRGALWGLIPIAALGLTNGWLRRVSGGLAAPWLLHSIYNGALIAASLVAGA